MEDRQIVELFLDRSQEAPAAAEAAYGAYCRSIARNVLESQEDAEEVLSDTLLALWNTIPPQQPDSLKAYMGRISRNLSLKRLRAGNAAKRGGGEIPLIWEELEAVTGSGKEGPEEALELQELTEALNRFLEELSETDRRIFLCRYWYCEKVSVIAGRFGCTESRVKMSLKRSRDRLRTALEKEGYIV